MILKKITLICFFTFCSAVAGNSQNQNNLEDYVSSLRDQGIPPVDFIDSVLTDHDLIIFDDALHSAQEPFDFYRELMTVPEIYKKVKYVFIEVLSITAQPAIDKYLQNSAKDSTLLIKVLQDDFSGYGWRYQTYVDLLETIRKINTTLPKNEQIRVICIDLPVYWESIRTRQDYDLFQKSLSGRDYFLYLMILEGMDHFNSGQKGIFLTNTRHAYKNIRRKSGELYWNCGTFFHQWHPGKTFSVRINNVILEIKAINETSGQTTSEGLERFDYRWARMDSGNWDMAFKAYGNKPVALPLSDNPFGRSPYVGNYMHNSANGQTMSDAYDGIIFLAPLEELHFSAQIDFIYTDTFKTELARRIKLLQQDRLAEFLSKNGAKSVESYIEQLTKYRPASRNTFIPK